MPSIVPVKWFLLLPLLWYIFSSSFFSWKRCYCFAFINRRNVEEKERERERKRERKVIFALVHSNQRAIISEGNFFSEKFSWGPIFIGNSCALIRVSHCTCIWTSFIYQRIFSVLMLLLALNQTKSAHTHAQVKGISIWPSLDPNERTGKKKKGVITKKVAAPSDHCTRSGRKKI